MYRNSIVPDPLRTGNRTLGLGSYGLHLYHELSAIGHSGTSGARAAAILVHAMLVGKSPSFCPLVDRKSLSNKKKNPSK